MNDRQNIRYDFSDGTSEIQDHPAGFLRYAFPKGPKHGAYVLCYNRTGKHDCYLDSDKSQAAGMPVFVEQADPKVSAQVTARPASRSVRPERVFISGAGTSGGAADWVINDIKIG